MLILIDHRRPRVEAVRSFFLAPHRPTTPSLADQLEHNPQPERHLELNDWPIQKQANQKRAWVF